MSSEQSTYKNPSTGENNKDIKNALVFDAVLWVALFATINDKMKYVVKVMNIIIFLLFCFVILSYTDIIPKGCVYFKISK